MKIKDGFEILSLQVDSRDIKKLDELARQEGIATRSAVVRMAISSYIRQKSAEARA